MNIDIDIIKANAAQVGQNKAALDAAIDEERTAEAAVLAAAIEAARPAWNAISCRLTKRQFNTSGRNGLHPASETEYHLARGCILINEYIKDEGTSGDSGTFHGSLLVLTAAGQLAVLNRTGHWSNWQGASNEWTSEFSIYKDARAAMDDWELDEALTGLAAALTKQLGGRAPDKAKAARERAERLSAIARLVK